MATGTEGGLLDGPRSQSVYKHAILDQYVIRYATMTANKLTPKRAVLFDGYAGRGRYDSGQAASAEHLMLAAQKQKASTQIDVFLVERASADYAVLNAVADEYRDRGITVVTDRGNCADKLDEALLFAQGASMFWFLDPCGAALPFDTLKGLLRARPRWPRTEFLMNFSAELIRRAGGQYKKRQLDLGGVAKVDSVCGGTWWREVALQAHLDSGATNWEVAAESVAREYARLLTEGTGYGWVVAPVRRERHHQPIYYLIFLTGDATGVWTFGDAASRARKTWFEALDRDEIDDYRFDVDLLKMQFDHEHEQAVGTITQNLRRLAADGRVVRVVDHTLEIFGEVYGEAKVTAFTAAVRDLVKNGEIEHVGVKAPRPHKFVLRRPTGR